MIAVATIGGLDEVEIQWPKGWADVVKRTVAFEEKEGKRVEYSIDVDTWKARLIIPECLAQGGTGWTIDGLCTYVLLNARLVRLSHRDKPSCSPLP